MPLSLILVVALIGCSADRDRELGRYTRKNDGLSLTDEEKLDRLYGREVVESHRSDFIQAGEMGERQEPIMHPRPPPIDMRRDFRQNELEETNILQNQALTPNLVRKLLRDLLHRLEVLEEAEENIQEGGRGQIAGETRCSLHGLWISAVTGVAFQLQPPSDVGARHTLDVRVVDSGVTRENQPRMITSQWTGTAQVSTESPTTISIILQEKVMEEGVEPKTAVFIGQCVVCTGSPTIQGTWVLFPKNQICFEPPKPPQSDVMYLLTH